MTYDHMSNEELLQELEIIQDEKEESQDKIDYLESVVESCIRDKKIIRRLLSNRGVSVDE